MNSATLHDKLKTKSIRSTFFAIVQTLSSAAYTQKVAFMAATTVMVQVTSFFILRPLHGQNAGTHSCTLVALSSVWYTNQTLRTRHNSRQIPKLPVNATLRRSGLTQPQRHSGTWVELIAQDAHHPQIVNRAHPQKRIDLCRTESNQV